jgi:hypothetical protein
MGNITLVPIITQRRDSSVRVAMGYWLEGRGSTPGRNKRFSPLHSVQTGSGTHPASYRMGIGGSFHWEKGAWA